MKILHDRPALNEDLAVIFSFCFLACLLLGWALTTFTSNIKPDPAFAPPTIIVNNAGPCLFQNGKWLVVESFRVEDKKYVCADLETDEVESDITFQFYKLGEMSLPIKVDSDVFKNGQIRFLVDHRLDPGEYTVLIRWARRLLAEFDFEVIP